MNIDVDLFLGNARPTHAVRAPSRVIGERSRREFELRERLGFGGNATVHSCLDAQTGEELAIKFQLNTSGMRGPRFVRERHIGEAVSHDHLIEYRDHGTVDCKSGRNRTASIQFVVMERAEGTLDQLIRSQAEILVEDYVGQFIGLAGALGVLQAIALHRDIKPDNILICNGKWLLSDFGLCSPKLPDALGDLTEEHERLGPRYWMSPEGMDDLLGVNGPDKTIDCSDVFQLAAVFWYVVCRRHPMGVLRRTDWKGPERLFDPVFRALHHDRTVRPANGSAFADALREATLT